MGKRTKTINEDEQNLQRAKKNVDPIFADALIDLVRDRRNLWDAKDRYHSDREKSDNAWAEISEKMRETGKFLLFR